MTVRTDRDHLTPRETLFVAALVDGRAREEAGAVAGVSPRTARRFAERPRVVAAIRKAQDEALGDTARRLQAGASQALATLEVIMSDSDLAATTRLRAALGWLDMVFRATELLTLAQRVAELEQRMEGGNESQGAA